MWRLLYYFIGLNQNQKYLKDPGWINTVRWRKLETLKYNLELLSLTKQSQDYGAGFNHKTVINLDYLWNQTFRDPTFETLTRLLSRNTETWTGCHLQHSVQKPFYNDHGSAVNSFHLLWKVQKNISENIERSSFHPALFVRKLFTRITSIKIRPPFMLGTNYRPVE